ncbi:MAG TPA: hypothetical protein VGR21_00015 [Cryptosporangiaceae bacterium]|nr:hypothetical protein [Cryptosporangiaceae bacterium]
MRKLAVTALVVAAVALTGAYVVSRRVDVRVPFVSDTCRVYAGEDVVRIDPDQLTHAATITAVAARRSLPPRAATIALATALQESKLRNIGYGDRDSVGLFQQRPSQGWGKPAQLSQPRYAASKFYDHLLRVPGWRTMRLTDAAQAVQRSGHPELYQKWEADATTLASALWGHQVGAVTCQLRQRQQRAGDKAPPALVAEFAADIGRLSVSPRSEKAASTLTVAVGGGAKSSLGWRTAHWFVAKSQEYGIERVGFAGIVWTAESGAWQPDRSAPDAQRVEVRIPART